MDNGWFAVRGMLVWFFALFLLCFGCRVVEGNDRPCLSMLFLILSVKESSGMGRNCGRMGRLGERDALVGQLAGTPVAMVRKRDW